MAHMVWICCISSFYASSSRNLHLCRCYALFLRPSSSSLLDITIYLLKRPPSRSFGDPELAKEHTVCWGVGFQSLENAQLSDREVTYQMVVIRLVEELLQNSQRTIGSQPLAIPLRSKRSALTSEQFNSSKYLSYRTGVCPCFWALYVNSLDIM
jgi:hypothetical protein